MNSKPRATVGAAVGSRSITQKIGQSSAGRPARRETLVLRGTTPSGMDRNRWWTHSSRLEGIEPSTSGLESIRDTMSPSCRTVPIIRGYETMLMILSTLSFPQLPVSYAGFRDHAIVEVWRGARQGKRTHPVFSLPLSEKHHPMRRKCLSVDPRSA